MTVLQAHTEGRRADENVGAREFGANPETHKLESYPLLDWLRFVLASVVALFHEGLPFPGPADGTLAVDVFFALSGWLIGGILVASRSSELPRFFFNRATRIWIPYAFAIFLLYGLAAAREGVGLNWATYLFHDVTFTHYNFIGPSQPDTAMPLAGTGKYFWTLSVEEQFYLVAPLFVFVLPFGKRVWPWLALAAVAAFFDSKAAPISLGVAAAVAHKDYGAWHLARWGRIIIFAVTAVSFAMLWKWDVTPLRAIFSTGMVLALATVGPRTRLGMFAGAVSYPLYLNHWIGAFVSHAIGHKIPLSPLAGIGVAYLFAVLAGIGAWAVVDRWVMARRRGWYSDKLGRRLALTAYFMVACGIIGGVIMRANLG
jgi:peptidoglycan/LPS O-acetylase OafA/YrhL